MGLIWANVGKLKLGMGLLLVYGTCIFISLVHLAGKLMEGLGFISRFRLQPSPPDPPLLYSYPLLSNKSSPHPVVIFHVLLAIVSTKA